MDIKNTIRDNRKKLAMTQEQIADYLGVTSSAVYKWEKGNAYPDITLLPALARVLKLDLNTLLSFHETLSQREIERKAKELMNIAETLGIQAVSNFAAEQVREYPRCDMLIYNMAMCMKAALNWFPADKQAREEAEYEEQIVRLFQRVSSSETESIRDSAQYMIFYHYLQNKDYEKAGIVLDEYKGDKVQKEQMQISLYVTQDNRVEARLLLERKLLRSAGDVQSTLSQLQGMYLKEEDMESARFLADTGRQIVEVLGLWEFGRYSSYIDLYTISKDTTNLIKSIRGMLEHAQKQWIVQESPLYRHIPEKEQEGIVQKQMKASIINGVLKDENFKFLQECEEGREFLKEMEGLL